MNWKKKNCEIFSKLKKKILHELKKKSYMEEKIEVENEKYNSIIFFSFFPGHYLWMSF